MPIIILSEKLREKFLSNTTQDGECLIWNGGKNLGGYGVYQVIRKGDKATIPIPRLIVAFRSNVDINDSTWHACHTCDKPACINPDHLYAGDSSTNKKDEWERSPTRLAKRFPKEFCKHGHRLEEVGVRKIRKRNGSYQWNCKKCLINTWKKSRDKRKNKNDN
jgi:hypothetical protein